jgi:hypothetical protein
MTDGGEPVGPSAVQLLPERLFRFFASLLAIAFPRQRFLHATLFTGLQIEGVALDFLDDVFLLDLPLEPAQCVFKGFALLNSNFRQKKYTSKHPHMGSFILLQWEGLRGILEGRTGDRAN